MITVDATVFVVDDDHAVRGSLHWLLESLDIDVQSFASAREFLSTYDAAQAGCLILDVRMPDISGLQLLEILAERQVRIPVIMISAYGDIAMAVRAMKAGAYDFIEKPFNPQVLLERIQQCLILDGRQRREAEEQRTILDRIDTLTPRENTVLDLVVTGKSNKQIANELGISVKTVEVHRAHIMDKMVVHSVAELTALHIASGLHKGKA